MGDRLEKLSDTTAKITKTVEEIVDANELVLAIKNNQANIKFFQLEINHNQELLDNESMQLEENQLQLDSLNQIGVAATPAQKDETVKM
jgi:hypothetical protein